MTLACCQPPAQDVTSPNGYMAPWTVVELWRLFKHSIAHPPPEHAVKAATLTEAHFPAQLYAAWHREFGARPLDEFRQCFATRGLLMDILQDHCGVSVECMADPFNQHHRLPVRFSASDRDWMFGMKHDSLDLPRHQPAPLLLEFLQLLPVHLRG